MNQHDIVRGLVEKTKLANGCKLRLIGRKLLIKIDDKWHVVIPDGELNEIAYYLWGFRAGLSCPHLRKENFDYTE